MTTTPPDPTNPNPLGAFVGLVGVLAIFIFFTGWVYRWAYFGFFELDVNSLSFPAESFFLVPIQVILGDPIRLIWAVLMVLLVAVVIKATVWLLEPLRFAPSRAATRSPRDLWLSRLHRFPLCQGLRQITDLFPQPLRRDLIIVAWVLIALFWLARWQGTEDAWRDAINPSSTRPMVTLVSPSDKIALGASLTDELIQDDTSNLEIPALKNLRIFGDVEQFRWLYSKGTNRANSSELVVWRLLIESGNWLYLFPALPDRQSNLRPPVVAVHTGDGRVQSVILSRPKVNP